MLKRAQFRHTHNQAFRVRIGAQHGFDRAIIVSLSASRMDGIAVEDVDYRNDLEFGHRILRIFVGEYVSGGGQWKNPDPALLPEGQMMAAGLVDDLTAVDGVQVLLARDPTLPPLRPDVDQCSTPDWDQAVSACDAAWIIAPESDGILLRLTRMVEAGGRLLLGCRADAVSVASSKIATARLLAAWGVPSIPTPDRCGVIPPSTTGWVAKPDDGAGACDMIATDDIDHLRHWLQSRLDTHVVQPRIDGLAASVLFLARDGEASVLSINSQSVELTHKDCRYLGGTIGEYEQHRAALAPLAAAAAAALPGLWGPVGIDVLLTETGPVVVEINPRLTTLWSGLHDALGINPAKMVLDLANGRPLPECRPIKKVKVTVP